MAKRTPWVVRPFEPRDAPAVKAMWKDGFMEMAWDMTRTLAPLIPFVPATKPIRPVAAAIALGGAARAAVALIRQEGKDKLVLGASIAGAGLSALALFHLQSRRMIGKMCDEACNAPSGDMFDIEETWVKAPGRMFFVAADPVTGEVVGSTAVAVGGVQDMPHGGEGHGAAKAKELKEPDACSVWKVSTAKQARGKGVAALLMEAAERWAADVAGAKRMVLVTASPGAKTFYRKIGYRLSGGSMRGANVSFWEKMLYPSSSLPSSSKGKGK